MLDGGIEYNNRGTLQPVLFTGQPKMLRTNPLTVRFSYKPAAKWSDGRPVSGADFRFLWQTQMNQSFDITSREGWEDISRVAVAGKTVTVTFRTSVRSVEGADRRRADPAARAAGRELQPGLAERLPEPEEQPADLVRSVRLQPLAAGLAARAVAEHELLGQEAVPQPAGLPSGRRHEHAVPGDPLGRALGPPAAAAAADRGRAPELEAPRPVRPGVRVEHIDIQQGEKGHPALKRKFVRQALMRGINRSAITSALYRTISPGLPVLNNVIFKPFESQYVPHWSKYTYNRQAAERLLRTNRCTKGSDGIYSCPRVGKLSFRFTSTAGNQLRELTFEVIQSQLKAVGIEVKSTFGPASHVFGTVLPGRDWDLFMFGWQGSPVSALTDVAIHGCTGDQNDMGYCNRTVTRLLTQASVELNDKKRNAMLNRADSLIANDIPQIPLMAKPGFLIHERRIQGIVRNPTQQTALWNVNAWWSTSR